MKRIVMTIAGFSTSLACLAYPALAGNAIPFEKVNGWHIERTAPGPKPQYCVMSKSYADTDRDNARTGVIVDLAYGKVHISLVSQNWSFDGFEDVNFPVTLGKGVALAETPWSGDGQTVTTTQSESFVSRMLASDKLAIKTEQGAADFDLIGFPEAYKSLRRCDAGGVSEAASTHRWVP